MPPEPQHGSKTMPSLGSNIATNVLTMLDGVKYSPPRLPSELANSPMKILVNAPYEVLAAVPLPEHVAGENIDKASQVIRRQVGSSVDAGKQASKLVGVGIFKKLKDVV